MLKFNENENLRKFDFENKFPIKLAIHGKAKTGKNLISDIFCRLCDEEFNVTYFCTSFASPLKNILIEIFSDSFGYQKMKDGLFGESSNRSKKISNLDKTYRDLLIEFSNFVSAYDPMIWINKVYKQIKQGGTRDVHIIYDIRFQKELFSLKENGFKIIKLIRPNNDYFLNVLSETDLDKIPNHFFDYIVVNDGSISDLEDKVRNILHKEINCGNS